MSRLATALGLRHPLVVAPMAGGPTSVALVAASSGAGALGSIGAAYLGADALRDFTAAVRALTEKPFAINFFVPAGPLKISDDQLRRAIQATREFRAELGIPEPSLEPPFEEDFDLQFEAALSLKPAVLSYVFGLLGAERVRSARKSGIFVIGTATSVQEAQSLEAEGAQAIVAQGVEAGGHRGIFGASDPDPAVPTVELVRSLKGKVSIPVLAAGGIMDAAGIREALAAGADAVQLGTAFLAVKEAGTSPPYRARLLASAERKTKTTRAFSGRLARGLVNRFLEHVEARPNSILPFPAQNKLTRDLRNASAARGTADFLSLWCGTGPGELCTGPAAELIGRLFPE